MMDTREYESLALQSGAYRDLEIGILKELLGSWRDYPGDPNTLLELRDGRVLAGFAIIAKARETDMTYEIRALCVDRLYRHKGVGKRLIEMLEEEALGSRRDVMVRIETSKLKEETIGGGIFLEEGYAMLGHIPDFYAPGDDYYIYARHVSTGGEAARGSPAEKSPDLPASGSMP
jgi:GNAT superfamily N-acetyltransferase